MECNLEMSSQEMHNTKLLKRKLQKVVGDLHHQKLISESDKQQIRLNTVPVSVWVTKEIVLLGVLPVSFSAPLYDASSKLAFGFLLKRGVLWGSCSYSCRRREAKKKHFTGKEKAGER